MKLRVVGEYFRYWINIHPDEIDEFVEKHRRGKKCRDFYIKKRIKQIFTENGDVVYQARRWDSYANRIV